jgi:hypothetical protein
MRGHEQIIQIRKSGIKPSGLVFIDDYPVKPVFLDWLQHQSMPTVCVHGDDIDALDMRFLVGLTVQVSGDDLMRVKRLAGACKRAGASAVFAKCGNNTAMWQTGSDSWLIF